MQLQRPSFDASIAWMIKARWQISTAVAALTSSFVHAQPAPLPSPILHEPIPALESDAPRAAIGGRSARSPATIAAGDKVLPQPTLDSPEIGARPPAVLGTRDFSADRHTSMQPDRSTGSDQTLHYISVFNPDVLPWKRMSAFDHVTERFTLNVQRSALSELTVGGEATSQTRDSFWGDVLVSLRPGIDVALPSVAPDMKILSYETKPPVRLIFSKDSADNFYVRSDESNAVGTFHVVFHADANAGYFAPQLPGRGYRVRDVVERAPPDVRSNIPAAVMREAAVTLRTLGLHRDLDLGVAFNALVDWGRGFAPGTIRRPSGNLYRDLSDHKAGVCRHRAYAFMVTANALGIPTRFVENEAHAFVEVWFPDREWQRIDLGGAAQQLEVTGANGKHLHRPRADDPFPKPPQYRNNYTQLEGNISGLTSQQRAQRNKPLERVPPGRQPGDAQNSQKPTPTIALTQASSSAYRGDKLRVEGFIRFGKRPLAGRLINVHLAPAGEHGSRSIHIGSLRSTADGSFGGDLPVPSLVTLTTYEIYVSSPEDVSYNAALSQ